MNKIKKMPCNSFNNGYCNVSFDVESQLSNVTIKKTIDIILKQIYVYKVISPNLRKTLNQKVFIRHIEFNGVICEQRDCVSGGSSLGPQLAHVIHYVKSVGPYSVRMQGNADQKNSEYEHLLRRRMTELDKIIKPLNNGNTIKFYRRYIDDTLNTLKV